MRNRRFVTFFSTVAQNNVSARESLQSLHSLIGLCLEKEWVHISSYELNQMRETFKQAIVTDSKHAALYQQCSDACFQLNEIRDRLQAESLAINMRNNCYLYGAVYIGAVFALIPAYTSTTAIFCAGFAAGQTASALFSQGLLSYQRKPHNEALKATMHSIEQELKAMPAPVPVVRNKH